jgi:membrane protein required for colicin V production
MNWLDIVILVIIFVFALFGLRRGLIREAVSILALLLGIVAGVMFYDLVGNLFVKHNLVENKAIGSVGGFIVVAFGVYVLIQLLGWILNRVIGALHLTWADRIGGSIFGVVKAMVISFLLVSALGFLLDENEPPFRSSVLVPFVNQTFSTIEDVVPKDFREKILNAKKLIHERGMEAATKETSKIKEVLREEEKK